MIEFTSGKLLLSVFVLLVFASVALFWHYAYDNMNPVFGTVESDEESDTSSITPLDNSTANIETNASTTNMSGIATINNAASNLTLLYEYPGIKLKMKYPGNWEKIDYGRAVKSYGEGVVVNFLSPLEDSSDQFRDFVLIKVENLSSSNLNKLPANNSIGGNPTFQVVSDRPNLANKSDIISTLKEWTSLDDKAFAVEFSAEKSKFKDYLPLVTQIIRSIEMNGVGTSSVQTTNQSDQPQASSISSQDDEATITSSNTTTQTSSVIEKLLQRDIDINETNADSQFDNTTNPEE